jgi:alpha-D-ribose 1-methylphosphonate 5-triphosphate synthase subunit PhnI
MLSLAYSSLRGYGSVHPTLAELRAGFVQLKISHPHTGEEVSIGEIFLTECEGILHSSIGGIEFEEAEGESGGGCEGEGDVEAGDLEGGKKFSLGYGLVFGQNERKAISMAILDGTTSAKDPKAPAEDQEFVFYHIDGVDAQGFIEHLKLPHYVTFQSSLDRAKRAGGNTD